MERKECKDQEILKIRRRCMSEQERSSVWDRQLCLAGSNSRNEFTREEKKEE